MGLHWNLKSYLGQLPLKSDLGNMIEMLFQVCLMKQFFDGWKRHHLFLKAELVSKIVCDCCTYQTQPDWPKKVEIQLDKCELTVCLCIELSQSVSLYSQVIYVLLLLCFQWTM